MVIHTRTRTREYPPVIHEVLRERDRLLKAGIPFDYIIYVSRNGHRDNETEDQHEGDRPYATLGVWFYGHEWDDFVELVEFQHAAPEPCPMDNFCMDGRLVHLMEGVLRGAISDDPAGWHEHLHRIVRRPLRV